MKTRFSKGRYYGAGLPVAVDRGSVVPEWSEASYSEPARAASLASDVGVPALQALISGMVAALLVAVGVMAWGWSWAAVGASGVGVLAITWALLLVDHRRLLWAVENLTSGDLDGDGVVGNPEPARLVLEVKQETSERRGLDFLHLDVDQAIFLTWARAALAGQSLAVAAWVGRGRPFTRGQYEGMLAELERSGIVRLSDARNPQNGRELTGAGRAALRACVHEYAMVTGHTDAHGGGVGERGQAVGAFVLIVGLLVVIALGAAFLDDALEAAQLAASAQVTEAQAVLTEAQAELAEAQARIAEAEAVEAQAENDRLLHEAAAYSIQKQADLVSYYAIRGDVRTVSMVLSVLVVIGAVAFGRAILRRWDAWLGPSKRDDLVSIHGQVVNGE